MSSDAEAPFWGPSPPAEEAASHYVRAITRRWKLVLAIALVTVAAGLVTVARRTRSYQSTATILVSPVSAGSQDLIGVGGVTDSGDPARNIETAAALIDSPTAAANAARVMGSGWTQNRVQSAVNVTPFGQSNVVAVTATADTPNDAKLLATAFANAALAHRASIVQANVALQLTQLRARLGALTSSTSALAADIATQIDALSAIQSSRRDPTLALASSAQLPTSATGAPSWLIMGLAVLAGLALGAIAAVFVERFSSKVRDEDEVRELLRAPILAGIPKLSRRVARQAPPPHLAPHEVQEQFRLLREQLSIRPDAAGMMITSSDAGDGKTTVACSLAAALAEANQDVILIDLDLAKPDVAHLFGVGKPVSNRVLTDWSVPLSEMIVPVPEYPRLRILPTEAADLVTLETVIDRFPHLIAEAKQISKWVIVDAPPLAMVSASIRLAQACDAVVVVVRPHVTDRSRLILARDVLTRVHAFVVGVVLVGQTIAKIRGPYGYGYGYGYRHRERGSADSGDQDAVPSPRVQRVGPTSADR